MLAKKAEEYLAVCLMEINCAIHNQKVRIGDFANPDFFLTKQYDINIYVPLKDHNLTRNEIPFAYFILIDLF